MRRGLLARSYVAIKGGAKPQAGSALRLALAGDAELGAELFDLAIADRQCGVAGGGRGSHRVKLRAHRGGVNFPGGQGAVREDGDEVVGHLDESAVDVVALFDIA